jgi:hypothetical protein
MEMGFGGMSATGGRLDVSYSIHFPDRLLTTREDASQADRKEAAELRLTAMGSPIASWV